MNKGDKIAVTIALALVVLALGILTYMAGRQHADIVQARTQINQQKAQIASLRNELGGRISGIHRDLITCSDISSMINAGDIASYYMDPNFNLQTFPANLPSHCINR